ncbi:excisionase [Erythrobacter sp. SAORIC-644]|nr:excisionase [Erythrobacter sp. SAORIC-644]
MDQRSDQRRQPAIEPIAMRVPEACRHFGIGRSTLYVLVSEGEIEFIKLGNWTLVLSENLKNLVA